MTQVDETTPTLASEAVESVLLGKPNKTLVVFAHGAGANMHSDFMEQVAQKLVETGVQVLRFNFLYMQANMQDGKRRPPDRAPKLLNYYQQVLVDTLSYINDGSLITENIILMGKSMGGRMSAMIMTPELADTDKVEIHPQFEQVKTLIKGVVCLGYPFVPLKGGEPRLSPINNASCPVMVLQGERDKFGGKLEIPHWPIKDSISLGWITDGDHSFKPRKSSGTDLEANLQDCVEQSQQFIDSLV
ncbi:dienelactone hydrolase family protein [Shewanella olleyana]|uniref:alpha/beta family hydrolase n=1 Tax=Shewanella olleyana TaxID=135626 RepID=UPI00200EE47B|nr:alpha/beta family hydrolase [Shewanella olleyana]MCL1066497.1 dienelactone hydrolase family protein [Shewanella olleyana]